MITKKQLLNKKFNMRGLIGEENMEGFEIEEEPTKNNSNEFCKIISILFHSQTQTHTLHLQTQSYAEHVALQKYYEGINPLTDTLVESYQGKYGILKGYKTMNIQDWESTEQTSNYLKKTFSQIEELKTCCEDTYILNQIDTICELINSTLYKLRFLN